MDMYTNKGANDPFPTGHVVATMDCNTLAMKVYVGPIGGTPFIAWSDGPRYEEQPVAFREERQELRQGRREAESRGNLGDRGLLAGDRHRRVDQHSLQRRMLVKQVRERRELRLYLLEAVLLAAGDVKERAGVTNGGGFVGHPVNILGLVSCVGETHTWAAERKAPPRSSRWLLEVTDSQEYLGKRPS